MEHLGAQIGFPFPPAAGQPPALQVANLSGESEFRQLRQRPLQYDPVTRAVARRSERPSHRMIHERGPGRRDLAHDVVGRADDQRRNAASFDRVGDETDGLMTEGSVGDEQGEIDPRLRELVGERGSKLILDLFMPAHPAHKRVVKRRQ